MMISILSFLQRNLPEGVAMKVTKYERKKLPEVINDHLIEITTNSQGHHQ